MADQTLQSLVAARVAAKRTEDSAAEARKALDEQIATLMVDPTKPEGTVSEKLDGFKVSTTYSVTRKVDTKALQAQWDTLQADAKACFNWKADLSISRFRQLDAADVLLLSPYIESKPASPSVKVEIL